MKTFVRSLLVVFAVALLPTALSAQTLTPMHQTIIFDANGKTMGAPVFQNYLRFKLADGRSALLPITLSGLWASRGILFANAGCMGTAAAVLTSPAPGSAASAIDFNNLLYVAAAGTPPANFNYQSILFDDGTCANGAGTQSDSIALSFYVDLDTLYAEPFSFAGGIEAPAVQSFADVSPASPFYQFVELMKASGVTVGCGNGTNFCPTANVTRQEMAVFISVALGLRFAP